MTNPFNFEKSLLGAPFGVSNSQSQTPEFEKILKLSNSNSGVWRQKSIFFKRIKLFVKL